jgi:hypothetical protein
MASVASAYPFIEVRITPPPAPVAQRAPGVIAVVGKVPDADSGSAAMNSPVRIETLDDARLQLASKANGTLVRNALYNSLELALLQNPRPTKIYGVKVKDDYAAGLAALEAVEDVTFVSLAREWDVGAAAQGANAPTNLMALKNHCETMSASGNRRIGVAMVDPTVGKSGTYVADTVKALTTGTANLRSDVSRMVVVAARSASEPEARDVATATMAAIAAYEPHVSTVLKPIRGLAIPKELQFSPSEIKGLSEEGIIPIIDPDLIVGESLHLAEGRFFTTDAKLLFIDIVRVLDDIEFRLRAGLIDQIGDARLTKYGLTILKLQTEGIIEPLRRRNVIDDFRIDIPLLELLGVPEAARTPGDTNLITEARANRTVDMIVTITYGPAVHRLRVNLAAKF